MLGATNAATGVAKKDRDIPNRDKAIVPGALRVIASTPTSAFRTKRAALPSFSDFNSEAILASTISLESSSTVNEILEFVDFIEYYFDQHCGYFKIDDGS